MVTITDLKYCDHVMGIVCIYGNLPQGVASVTCYIKSPAAHAAASCTVYIRTENFLVLWHYFMKNTVPLSLTLERELISCRYEL